MTVWCSRGVTLTFFAATLTGMNLKPVSPCAIRVYEGDISRGWMTNFQRITEDPKAAYVARDEYQVSNIGLLGIELTENQPQYRTVLEPIDA